MTDRTHRADRPTDQPPSTDPVVVVGAGPAGLVAAVTLARMGVDVLVLEQRLERSALPRAVGITLRQMELLRSWGLEERVLAGGDDVDLAILETVNATNAAAGIRHEINVPTRTQSAVVSPTAPARVPQDHLERVLLEHLEALPTAEVRRGVAVNGLTPQERAVHLDVYDERTGVTREVVADYVVAADGAHSSVRMALGIPMVGPDDMMSGLSVEFRADLWPILGERRFALYTITDPAGAGVLIPTGQRQRWQFGIVLHDGDDPAVLADPAVLRQRIRAAAGVADLPVEIVRVHPFCSAAQLADRFSDGRVFLVGDAAHRVTPRGGNGLALAVRSGLDLGWRLAWVARGWAPEAFLESYEAEARPVSADSVARAADPDGFCRAVISEMQLDLGGRLPHAWVAPGMSTLDLIGPGLTLLVTDDLGPSWAGEVMSTRRIPLAVERLPPLAAHALGLHRPGGAVLVRPDGVPIASWRTAHDLAELVDRAIDELLRPPRVESSTTRPTKPTRPSRPTEPIEGAMT